MKRVPLAEITSQYETRTFGKSNFFSTDIKQIHTEEFKMLQSKSLISEELPKRTKEVPLAESYSNHPLSELHRVPTDNETMLSSNFLKDCKQRRKTKSLLQSNHKLAHKSKFNHQFTLKQLTPKEKRRLRMSKYNGTEEMKSLYLKPNDSPFKIYCDSDLIHNCNNSDLKMLQTENYNLVPNFKSTPEQSHKRVINIANYTCEKSFQVGRIIINLDKNDVFSSKSEYRTLRVIL